MIRICLSNLILKNEMKITCHSWKFDLDSKKMKKLILIICTQCRPSKMVVLSVVTVHASKYGVQFGTLVRTINIKPLKKV